MKMLLIQALPSLQGSGASLPVQLLNCVFDSLTTTDEDGRLVSANLTPVSLELGGQLLELAFQIGIEVGTTCQI